MPQTGAWGAARGAVRNERQSNSNSPPHPQGLIGDVPTTTPSDIHSVSGREGRSANFRPPHDAALSSVHRQAHPGDEGGFVGR